METSTLCWHELISVFPSNVLGLIQNIGGGWIEAQNSRGEVGLVPEDYIEVS